VPVFWSGLLFLYLFAVKLQVFPVTGRLDPRTMPPEFHTGLFTVDALIDRNWPIFMEACTHLILPSLVLGWSVLGIVARVVRASMLDVLDQDFILMARAKGASEIRVLTNHALRNALVPVITIIAFSFAYLITGAVLTEAVFAWPGIGSYAVESARAIDYPAILGVTLIAGVSFLLTNLVADICYVIVDPRIRTGHQQ
jgi:peptide/nickel transport system permease protein